MNELKYTTHKSITDPKLKACLCTQFTPIKQFEKDTPYQFTISLYFGVQNRPVKLYQLNQTQTQTQTRPKDRTNDQQCNHNSHNRDPDPSRLSDALSLTEQQ